MMLTRKDLDELEDFCSTGISLASSMGKNPYVIRKLLLEFLKRLPEDTMELTITEEPQLDRAIYSYVYISKKAQEAQTEGENERDRYE